MAKEPQPHATTGKYWCGYVCGNIPTKQDKNSDAYPLYSRSYMKG